LDRAVPLPLKRRKLKELEQLIEYMHEMDCPSRKRFNFDIIGVSGRVGQGHLNATVPLIRHLKKKAKEMRLLVLITSTEPTENKDTIH